MGWEEHKIKKKINRIQKAVKEAKKDLRGLDISN